MSDTDSDRDPSSGTHLGDFTLLRRLGRGAQGEVYEARQQSLGRLVALKVLPPYLTFSPDRVQRFRREAEAGGRLDHPNTVGVHAVGEFEGYHYIAQELVAGGRTLGDRIAEARREAELPRDWCEKTAVMFVQVADAVQAAHEAGIIHRDLKPGNILLTRDGQPKVADFGLAMVLDDLHRSRSGELIGTPFYMSPEQAAGGRAGLDQRTDVFSLGATLYEALTLQRPFEGETREKIVEQILLHDPREPRKVRPSVPRELSVICMKALEKRRERRYQTAAEFADDLGRWLRHEPIRARPPGAVVRTGKWLRRHPVLSSAGSVALVAVVALSWLMVDNLAAWSSSRRNQEAANKADRENRLAVDGLLSKLLDTGSLGIYNEPSPPPPDADPFRTILGKAARAAATMGELPEVQWQLQLFTGMHYRNMSLFDEADQLLSASLATAQAGVATDPGFADRLAHSQLELGKLRYWTARWEEAEALIVQARSAFIRLYGPQDLRAASAGMALARLEFDSGRPAAAETTIREVIAGWNDGSDDSPELLWARQFLGTLLLDQGRYDESAEQLLPVYSRAHDVYPEVEWVRLGFRVAHLHDFRGRAAAAGDPGLAQAEDEQAERLYRDGIARLRELDGRPREDVANALVNFGSFLRARGRRDEARPVLEDALESAKRATGLDSRSALAARNSLALCLYELDRIPEAEALWQEAVACDKRAPERDSRPALSALKSLATLCRHQQRRAEALAFAQELVARTPHDDPAYAGRAQLLAEIEQQPDSQTTPP